MTIKSSSLTLSSRCLTDLIGALLEPRQSLISSSQRSLLTMRLFEPKKRTDFTPSSFKETTFDFLDRSGLTEAGRVRDTLNAWFSHVAEDEQPRLRADLVASKEVQFASAVFELALHEIGIKLGYASELHPTMNGVAAKPDFRFSRGTESLIVEARNVTCLSEAERGAEKRKAETYEAIDKLFSPDFSLQVHDIRGAPQKTVPAKKLGADLLKWLGEQPYDELRALQKDGKRDQLPTYDWNSDGWRLRFRAIPRPERARGKPGRLIGARVSGGLGTGPDPIATALKEKATKYGKLQEPYLIALNITGHYTDQRDLEDALFGRSALRLDVDTQEVDEVRKPDGIWIGKDGWRAQQVSGVLVFHGYDVWHSARAPVVLYPHPSPFRAVDGPFAGFTKKAVDDAGFLKEETGAKLHQVFELPERWPDV